MKKHLVQKLLLFVFLVQIAPVMAADLPIEGYAYSVTDIAPKGLSAQKLFNGLPTSWMDLEHSVCANRAQVWSHELHRRYGINTGTIFVFFGAKVWEGEKHKYWYHAGTYVVENGQELVLEQSYPSEVSRPLTIVEWMHNEMEGKADASKCVELKKDLDRDMTERFYYHAFLPNKRPDGKPAYHCYYRKVPGYIPYPEMVAELELGVDENGKKVDYDLNGFDGDLVWNACVDAYAGRNFFKKGPARAFCTKFLK